MSNIKDNVNELNQMILNGQIVEAFDKFYAPEVVMQENYSEPRKGFDTCRKFEEEFVANLTEFRGAAITNMFISEETGVATIEWDMDYSHKEWGDRKYKQVTVQKWENGKVVNEQFLYNN